MKEQKPTPRKQGRVAEVKQDTNGWICYGHKDRPHPDNPVYMHKAGGQLSGSRKVQTYKCKTCGYVLVDTKTEGKNE